MGNRQLSLREKTKSALERIGTLEENAENLGKALERELGKMFNRLDNLEETLAAVTKSIGRDVVDALVVDARKEKQTVQADQAKTEIAKLVEQKVLVPAETVGEDSFIVGHDVDAEGNVVHPGFGHVHFRQVDPKHQETVKGAKPGTAIPTGAEGSKAAFVIDEIFTFVPPTTPPAGAEVPAADATTTPVNADAELLTGAPEGTVVS